MGAEVARGEGGGEVIREQFDVQLGRLLILKGTPADIEEYFPALTDIDVEVFSEACSYALKTRTWFPVPSELRSDCDVVRVRVRRIDPEPPYHDLDIAPTVEIKNPFGGASIFVKVVRDWHHDCDGCSDTGWAGKDCAGDTTCGRRRPHAAHNYVEPCVCIEWNPTIRRRKEAKMKYSQTDKVRA